MPINTAAYLRGLFARRTKQSEIIVLAASAVPISVGATTAEEVLASITVPGGALGPNGWMRWSLGVSLTGNSNNKILRVRANGVEGPIIQSFTINSVSTVWLYLLRELQNRGVENSQLMSASAGASGPSATLGAAGTLSEIDTAKNWTFTITGQKASAGDALTLERYAVELHRRP